VLERRGREDHPQAREGAGHPLDHRDTRPARGQDDGGLGPLQGLLPAPRERY